MFLHAALLVVRYKRAGGFLILHPRSASVLPTDALGAWAIRQFLLGYSAATIGKRLEQQCPGAEPRWERLVGALYEMGAVAHQAPERTRWWWTRTLISLALGPVLSLLTLLLSIMPVWILLRVYKWLPSTPLSARTLDHLLPFIEANLCAAGYTDRPPAWRRDIAREVAAATIRTHFVTYLTLILPREKVLSLVERVTALHGMDRLRQAYATHAGAIVVGLHWELFIAPVLLVERSWPVAALANVGMAEYSVASKRESPLSTLIDRVDSSATMAAKALAQRLHAGQIVMLTLDVALPPGTHGTLTRKIQFLGQCVARFDTAAWLSRYTRKPILFVSIYREGKQLVLDFTPLDPPAGLSPDEEVTYLTARLYEMAEQRIRQHPAAWLVWSYLHTLSVAAP